ncbi:MAG: arginyltransferase [Aestuariivita sp.]|nr:arginyltransferase [Aestuariivita sp.]
MRHTSPIKPQFFVTSPQHCPYLAGQMERKLFTTLNNKDAEKLNNSLTQQGFRRSQNVIYRPSCMNCAACLPVRINVSIFKSSKSQRRTLQRNRHLVRNVKHAIATKEGYDLFQRYLNGRHPNGGMTDMDCSEFQDMIEDTPVQSRLVEYREGDSLKLIAVSMTDILQDGISMMYSFFSPTQSKQSLGTFMILDHVTLAQQQKLHYVYLGYWVHGSKKMHYKSKFSGLEVFIGGQWQHLSDIDSFTRSSIPSATEGIKSQIASIRLPDRIS